jgi:hypothetical protein
MNDLPSFRLPAENKSAPTHRAAIDQMESDQHHIFRQLLNAQIEWVKTHVRWRSAARTFLDSIEDAEPCLFELLRRIDELCIWSRRMENSRGGAEASPKGLPVGLSRAVTNADKASSTEAVFGFANLCSCATVACEVAIAKIPTTMCFFQSMLRTSKHSRSISAGKF